uniref:CLN3 lysosomal/endosomal transmembrane protein, battenin n=1 Tax=Oryzias latipes TaxID=8090 RepID=A0A3P9HPL0_ORYLA
MLSAAHDILTKEESKNAVLLADILPTLIIKFIAPVFIHKVPYGPVLFLQFLEMFKKRSEGFRRASCDQRLLCGSLTVFPACPRNVLEGWGSGTGGAGVAGALLYSGLIQAGLPPPGDRAGHAGGPGFHAHQVRGELAAPHTADRVGSAASDSGAFEQGLLKFMGPLALVYFAEYFINQGLLELLFFPNFSLSHADQYRWYQTIYQFGVFASRSSLHCVKIRRVWILTLLQVVNAVFLLLAVKFQFLPSAWLLFVIIFYEGLLGGAAYVNTFHFISKETESRHREFAMAASSVGDSFGIALAALAAFFVHQYFCSL